MDDNNSDLIAELREYGILYPEALITKLTDEAADALESFSPRVVASEAALVELEEMTLFRVNYKLRAGSKDVSQVWHFLVSGRDNGGAASGQAEVVGRGRLPKVWSTYAPLGGVFTVLWSPSDGGNNN